MLKLKFRKKNISRSNSLRETDIDDERPVLVPLLFWLPFAAFPLSLILLMLVLLCFVPNSANFQQTSSRNCTLDFWVLKKEQKFRSWRSRLTVNFIKFERTFFVNIEWDLQTNDIFRRKNQWSVNFVFKIYFYSNFETYGCTCKNPLNTVFCLRALFFEFTRLKSFSNPFRTRPKIFVFLSMTNLSTNIGLRCERKIKLCWKIIYYLLEKCIFF